MGDLTTTQLRRIGQGHCPDCGHRGFVIGPQGSLNINVECGACRSRFSVAFWASSVVSGARIESRAEGSHAWASDPDEPAPAMVSARTIPIELLQRIAEDIGYELRPRTRQ